MIDIDYIDHGSILVFGLNRKRVCHQIINVPACPWSVAQHWIASIVSSPPLQYQPVLPPLHIPKLGRDSALHCGVDYYLDCLGISLTDHSTFELISGECIENINFDKYCIWGSFQETIRICQAARACLSHRTFFFLSYYPKVASTFLQRHLYN